MDESDYRESEDEDYQVEQVSEQEVDSDVEETTAKAIKDQQQGVQTERFARTRSQVDSTIKHEPVAVKSSSVDVDALWAEMNAPSAVSASTSGPAVPVSESGSTRVSGASVPAKPSTGSSPLKDEMITITRTYKFAGKITTETKTVKATSAEGKEYLEAKKAESVAPQPKPKRRVGPVKRAISLEDEFMAGKAKKLNTLAKSKLDWLGFVDKEGIQADLEKHNKSGYLDKQDFLGRVDMNLERNHKR